MKVTAGCQAILKCTSASDVDVLWSYSDTSDGEMHDVYSHGVIVNGYRGRFSFKNTSSDGKNHSLIITRAESRDAGVYWCIERNGIGDHHEVLLSVIGEITASLRIYSFICYVFSGYTGLCELYRKMMSTPCFIINYWHYTIYVG